MSRHRFLSRWVAKAPGILGLVLLGEYGVGDLSRTERADCVHGEFHRDLAIVQHESGRQ